MEENINRIFDEKMMYLKDTSKKNIINMKNIKHELNFAIMNLKADYTSKTIGELRKELKSMVERRIDLIDEINQIKKELHTLNNLNRDPTVKIKVNLNNIFVSEYSSDHKLIRKYFKEIVHITKNIQEKMEQNKHYS